MLGLSFIVSQLKLTDIEPRDTRPCFLTPSRSVPLSVDLRQRWFSDRIIKPGDVVRLVITLNREKTIKKEQKKKKNKEQNGTCSNIVR